jgi:hypothetical protein
MAFGTSPFKRHASKDVAYGASIIATKMAFLAIKVGLLFRKVFLLVLGVIERNPYGSRRRVRRELRMTITERVETQHVACLAALRSDRFKRGISTLMLSMALTALCLGKVR